LKFFRTFRGFIVILWNRPFSKRQSNVLKRQRQTKDNRLFMEIYPQQFYDVQEFLCLDIDVQEKQAKWI